MITDEEGWVVWREAGESSHQDCCEKQDQHRPPPTKPVTDQPTEEDSAHQAKKGHLLLQLPEAVPLIS